MLESVEGGARIIRSGTHDYIDLVEVLDAGYGVSVEQGQIGVLAHLHVPIVACPSRKFAPFSVVICRAVRADSPDTLSRTSPWLIAVVVVTVVQPSDSRPSTQASSNRKPGRLSTECPGHPSLVLITGAKLHSFSYRSVLIYC